MQKTPALRSTEAFFIPSFVRGPTTGWAQVAEQRTSVEVTEPFGFEPAPV